jgi:hypothetical protein
MRKKMIPTLSKSRFLAGLQCPLRLWHQCYTRELALDVSPVQEAVFDTGHDTLAMLRIREELISRISRLPSGSQVVLC